MALGVISHKRGAQCLLKQIPHRKKLVLEETERRLMTCGVVSRFAVSHALYALVIFLHFKQIK